MRSSSCFIGQCNGAVYAASSISTVKLGTDTLTIAVASCFTVKPHPHHSQQCLLKFSDRKMPESVWLPFLVMWNTCRSNVLANVIQWEKRRRKKCTLFSRWTPCTCQSSVNWFVQLVTVEIHCCLWSLDVDKHLNREALTSLNTDPMHHACWSGCWWPSLSVCRPLSDPVAWPIWSGDHTASPLPVSLTSTVLTATETTAKT